MKVFENLCNYSSYLLAILINFDDVQAEFPEIDFQEFYKLAKQIYDEILNSDDNEWKSLLESSLTCRSQVNFMNSCVEESLSLNLTEVIWTHNDNFEALHDEIDKG